MKETAPDGLPVVVVGAGPVGLAAAAHLRERGMPAIVLEAGPEPATSVARWGHVRMFSAWPELVDPASRRLLESRGWQPPTHGYPTGAQWRAHYLVPLALALADSIRCSTRVVGVARRGRDRLVDGGRDRTPFAVHLRDRDGVEWVQPARAVLDASGTWTEPGPAGADGLLVPGETALAARGLVRYRIPDPADARGSAGRHTVVLGSGDSAFTAIHALAQIAATDPGTRITWAIRRGISGATFGGGIADQLPQRGALGLQARAAVERGLVTLVTGFRTRGLHELDDRTVQVSGEDGRLLGPADTVIALTGHRPDLSFLSEVRLDLDPTLQAPRALADQIDPNRHSCGSVRATGAAELAQPERDFFVVGMKSYGRAPTFLALTGFEQVRSVVAALAGDVEAARRVDLALPETGLCGGTGLSEDDGPPALDGGPSGCCVTIPAVPLPLDRRT